MNLAQLVEVDADDGDVRLDRWFRRRYPELKHGQLEKEGSSTVGRMGQPPGVCETT